MQRLFSNLGLTLLAALFLAACSGVETIPDDTAAFAAKGYTSYAWRSEPLTQSSRGTDRLYQADPIIRAAIKDRLSALGYREVAKEDAQFLIEYLAAAGINDGRLSRTASNVTPYPSATINRQADGATVDNAYALGGVVETGNLLIVFADAANIEPLWRVGISTVVQDANNVDERGIKSAIRQGLASLPEAPQTP